MFLEQKEEPFHLIKFLKYLGKIKQVNEDNKKFNIQDNWKQNNKLKRYITSLVQMAKQNKIKNLSPNEIKQ